MVLYSTALCMVTTVHIKTLTRESTTDTLAQAAERKVAEAMADMAVAMVAHTEIMAAIKITAIMAVTVNKP